MKKIVLISLTLVLFFGSACEPLYKKRLNKSIATSEQILLNDEQGLNDSIASSLLNDYQKYVEHYPEDKRAGGYLYKAADLASGMGLSTLAIQLYKRVYDEYPSFEERPMCLFIMAFIYEENLGDNKKAEELYREFLEKYPDHELAKDVEMSIQNLGKSPEELIREFEKQLMETEEI